MNLFPMRSILFTPANQLKLVQKAANSDADIVCLDLEDAISFAQKPMARTFLAEAANILSAANKPFWVRVNSELEELVADIAYLPQNSAAVVLSKARDLTHIALLGELLDRKFIQGGPAIVGLVEDANSIAAFTACATQRMHPRLSALALGMEDLATSLSASTESGIITHLFHELVIAAQRLDVASLGYPGSIADYKNIEKFSMPLPSAAASGAVGGFCIHPAQTQPLNQFFGISPDTLIWAKKVKKAFEGGDGVVSVDGKMIDLPVYLRALNLIKRGKI